MSSAPAQPSRGCFAWIAAVVVVILYGALALALFVVTFYAEENWRGARAWQQTQADLAAKGETLDASRLIPPPVPEAENYGALPFFQEVSVSKTDKDYKKTAISQTLKSVTEHLPYSKETGLEPGSLPYLGNWQKGETVDSASITKQLIEFLQKQSPGVQVPLNASPAQIFALICPVLTELRAANATHPACRFDLDYPNMRPWTMSFGAITDPISIEKVLAYDERLDLLSGRPDLALDDLKVTLKIQSGLRQEPILVSVLVGIGMIAIQLGAVNEGLAQHAWNDQVLVVIDDALGKIDSLSDSQHCLRGEMAFFTVPMLDYFEAHRSHWAQSKQVEDNLSGEFFGKKVPWTDRAITATYGLVPQGWFDQYKSESLRLVLLDGLPIVDPAAHRAYPDREKEVFPPTDSLSRWANFVAATAHPIVNILQKAAYQQVQLDEARVSCRLERYRLAHGFYPATLQDLVPTYGADLPHDVMSGQPYHYKLNADQTYLLYSVGWDQKDDGGNAGKTRNTESPDWIWTNYPNQK